MFTTPASGPSVFGRKSILTFVENAIKGGAIFNVYRSKGKKLQKEITSGEGPEHQEDEKELILILQEILSKAERLVDGLSQKGRFLSAFKKSLLEKVDAYPSLDPFSGEFNYEDGSIQLMGEVPRKDFINGVGQCLRDALSEVEKELPKNKMLSLKWKAELESSFEAHRAAMSRLGVDVVFSSLFQ